jgi:hypothetical protein
MVERTQETNTYNTIPREHFPGVAVFLFMTSVSRLTGKYFSNNTFPTYEVKPWQFSDLAHDYQTYLDNLTFSTPKEEQLFKNRLIRKARKIQDLIREVKNQDVLYEEMQNTKVSLGPLIIK